MYKRQKPFGEIFLERLHELEEEANACGITMTALCKEAGISRASPDRWRTELPKTIKLIEKMEEIVSEAQKQIRREVVKAQIKKRSVRARAA